MFENHTHDTESLVLIGRIGRCHGIRGDVRVQSYSSHEGRFAGLDAVFIGLDTRDAAYRRIDRVQETASGIVMHFDGIDSRTDAEEIVGRHIYIRESEMKSAPEGAHYIHDLIGMTMRSDDDRYTGVLREVLQLPAHDAFAFEVEGREVLVPNVPEFILSIDASVRCIVVRNVPGLFED